MSQLVFDKVGIELIGQLVHCKGLLRLSFELH